MLCIHRNINTLLKSPPNRHNNCIPALGQNTYLVWHGRRRKSFSPLDHPLRMRDIRKADPHIDCRLYALYFGSSVWQKALFCYLQKEEMLTIVLKIGKQNVKTLKTRLFRASTKGHFAQKVGMILVRDWVEYIRCRWHTYSKSIVTKPYQRNLDYI